MTSEPGKILPPSPFSGDDGSPSPEIEAALAAYERGEGGAAQVLAALAAGRLLVPVVAVLDEMAEPAEPDELAGDPSRPAGEKESHMATVMTVGRDGRRGLLAFTCVDAVRRWDPQARPMPVSTRSAAEAALAEGADALVIDLAGPVMFAIDAPELRSLAAGWRPVDPWHAADEVEKAGQSAQDDRSSGARSRLRASGGRMFSRFRRP